jgi:hypothetical protein
MRLLGRATGVAGSWTLGRLLARIDATADAEGAPPESWPPAFVVDAPSPAMLDLRAERIWTVVWATGFRRDYAWLQVPVLDAAGEIRRAAERRQLLAIDERSLKDLGITRYDAIIEGTRPWWMP